MPIGGDKDGAGLQASISKRGGESKRRSRIPIRDRGQRLQHLRAVAPSQAGPEGCQSSSSRTGTHPMGHSFRDACLKDSAQAHFGDSFHYHRAYLPQALRNTGAAHELEKRKLEVLTNLMNSLKFSRMGARERNVAIA